MQFHVGLLSGKVKGVLNFAKKGEGSQLQQFCRGGKESTEEKRAEDVGFSFGLEDYEFFSDCDGVLRRFVYEEMDFPEGGEHEGHVVHELEMRKEDQPHEISNMMWKFCGE
jgi:hypothetical protein